MSSQPYDNYGGFSNQLASIGLKIRDIPGDGYGDVLNKLFLNQ